MTGNPWSDIKPPDSSEELTGRRADPDHPFEFWRSRDVRKRPVFLLKFHPGSRGALSLPNPRGLEVSEQSFPGERMHQLVIVLREEGNVDIFHRLCLDLMDATRTSENEPAAVATTIARLVRWQQLLRSGMRDKLTGNEQKGLIGELLFLRDVLIPKFGMIDSVSFWVGSLDGESRKDFCIGQASVEVKTRTGTSPSRVLISSEEQLDHAGFERLYLAVYEIAVASGDSNQGFNLHDLVGEIRGVIMNGSPSSADLFEQRLEARGFSDAHDYENDRYVDLGVVSHEVKEGFPRIVRSEVPAGVMDLTYALDLAACMDFRISIEELTAGLGSAA